MATKKTNENKAKPFTPKAGYTRNNAKRRYACGGKLTKKSK